MELTTVDDTSAVFHDGSRILLAEELEPDTEYERFGVTFATLPRPPGSRLATIATVNDIHLGETECGRSDDTGLGPIMHSEPGEAPYPEMMSRAAVDEIAVIEPDVVVAKGDLTARAAPDEIAMFFEYFGQAFGSRLHYILGNHDVGPDGPLGWPAGPRMSEVVVDGVRLALLDTTVPGVVWGGVDAEQLEWLDDLAAGSDRPLMVFGHHPRWDPASPVPGLNEDDTDRLTELVARRPTICGYFAGHTHRNRVFRVPATGDTPWAEVSATKDYPGAWAEYRIFEGGIIALTHRVSSPEALRWTERTRAMFGGLYPLYSFGEIEDRCFTIPFVTAR